MDDTVLILNVTKEDARELLEIYTPYVLNTAISFEIEPPTLTEFEGRIVAITSKYPYLKAVDINGKILGYCYANTFKERAAYDHCVETTIYLREEAKRQGIGSALYAKLEKELVKRGILNANACIGVPPQENPYVNMDSVLFHEKMGYKMVGTFHNCGRKFDQWFHMCWMEKLLGDYK
ncbi:MAG: N-acetyltransferase [Lachnospiraceae bacterium]|nr:N-acetyltransferase [Candidatus Merdinaster equi]